MTTKDDDQATGFADVPLYSVPGQNGYPDLPKAPPQFPIYVLSEGENILRWTTNRAEAEAWIDDDERILPGVDVLMPGGEIEVFGLEVPRATR